MKKGARIIVSIVGVMLGLMFFNTSTFALEETTWQNDWTFSKNTSAKIITLTKYNGSEATYKVPATAVIDGEEWTVTFGSAAGKTSAIKNLSFEEGVVVTATSSLFSGNTSIESIDLRGANTSAATNFYYMFNGCTNLTEINMSGIDTSNVTNLRYMFYNASNLKKLDMSNLNLDKVTGNGSTGTTNYIYGMFYNASKIEEIIFANTSMSRVSSFAYSNATRNFSASPIYAMYNLKKIDFSSFNTPNLTTAQRMFTIDANNSGNRNVVEEIDVTNWNISKVTTLNEAFKHCGENNEVVIKGLETLDVSKVTDFGGTFQSTYNLKDLSGVEGWDTSSAIRMNSMFSEAKSITKLDLSGWDTSNVVTLGSIFSHCEALTDLNVSTWDTSKVATMDGAFKSCASLEVLNIKSWTTESIEDKAGSHMWEMFGPQTISSEHPMTPLKELTLNDNFKFSTFGPPGLRSGYWHLKEGTASETTPKFTPGRLYTAYNNGVTPPEGYSYDHTYVLTELDPAQATYYARGWGDNNAWEVHYPDDRFKAYCINLHRGSPNGYYDRTLVGDNKIVTEGFLDSDNYGYEPLGSTMEEALITLIYYGYGNNADGIQEKYGLSDSDYLMITQQAIWDYTDRYNNIPERDQSTNYGKAYYELVSKRFSEIPDHENLKLYVYESTDGKQNLLSISGLSDEAHAGVRVLKLTNALDGSLEPLIGAEFTIYDSDRQAVATIVSDENGYATKYNTDSIYGLPEGAYTIRETSAPRGYIKTNAYYSFIVRKSDDNEIILVGKLSGQGEDTAMIFENTTNHDVEGGGLVIKIVDEEDTPILTGATFEIIDESGAVIDTITTGGNGSYKTGKKDLELNKKYTARLKNPPAGYITTVEIQDETLTENETYKTLIFKFIKKTCEVNLEATKKYNSELKGNDFEFELNNINNQSVIRRKNDKNGKINFNLKFDATNLGYEIYNLREIDSGNSDIVYDTHAEEIVISVADEGEPNLTCELMDSDKEIEFINVTKVEPPETGILTSSNEKNSTTDKAIPMAAFLSLTQILYLIVYKKYDKIIDKK